MAKSAVVKTSQVAEVVFSGINGLPEDQQKFGVTADHVDAVGQEKAGGNPNNVGVRLVATVDPKAEQPLPYEAKNTLYDKDGQPKTTLRAKVVWQLINSAKHPITLQDVDNCHTSIKARKYHALLDALNGGQSPAKKATWGNAFVELFVIPAK